MKQSNKVEEIKSKLTRGALYFFSALVLLMILVVLLSVLMTRSSGKPPTFFNHSLLLVTSGSMEPAIGAKDAIVIKKMNPNLLAVDDVITYADGKDAKGRLILNTHRIVAVVPGDTGLTFTTKGDGNSAPDTGFRSANDILGKVVRIMPGFGKTLSFIKSPVGTVVCIAVPLLLLLLSEIFNLFRLAKVPQQVIEEEVKDLGRAQTFGNHARKPKREKKRRFGFGKDKDTYGLSDEEDINYPATSLQSLGSNPYTKKHSWLKVLPFNKNEEEGRISTIKDEEDAKPVRRITTVRDEEIFHPTTKAEKPSFHQITTAKDEEIKKPQHRITTIKDEEPVKAPYKITTAKDEEAARPVHRITTANDEEMEQLMQNTIVDTMDGFAFIKPKNSATMSDQEKEIKLINKFFSGENDLALITNGGGQSFTGAVQSHGNDSFSIDGINVSVDSTSIQLGLDKRNKARDISISVTSDYTNVVIDGKDFEINFALFKDDSDNEQKVVVQRRVKY